MYNTYFNVNGPEISGLQPKHTAKEPIKAGHLVFAESPDVDGDTLVNATPANAPHDVWIAEEAPNPINNPQWIDEVKPEDHVYQKGERVETIETFPRYNYRVWLYNGTGLQLNLAGGELLKISPTVPGQLEVIGSVANPPTTVAELVRLNRAIFMVDYSTVGDTTVRTIEDTESGLVFVKRVGG
jgi:hypothetical protein